MDATKLIKLLNLTRSDHDGEALSAIRKANELLAREGRQWSDVVWDIVRSQIRQTESPFKGGFPDSEGGWTEDEYRGFKRTAFGVYRNPGMNAEVRITITGGWYIQRTVRGQIQRDKVVYSSVRSAITHFWEE